MKRLLIVLLLTIPIIGLGQLSTGYYISDFYLYKTTDSGVNWTIQNTLMNYGNHYNINFINETTGYYMSGSNLYKTTDSGVNWTIQNTQINYWNHYNISFVNENTTNIENIITSISDRKLEKIVNIKGQETKPQPNILFIEIYDDGSTEKKLIIEK